MLRLSRDRRRTDFQSGTGTRGPRKKSEMSFCSSAMASSCAVDGCVLSVQRSFLGPFRTASRSVPSTVHPVERPLGQVQPRVFAGPYDQGMHALLSLQRSRGHGHIWGHEMRAERATGFPAPPGSVLPCFHFPRGGNPHAQVSQPTCAWMYTQLRQETTRRASVWSETRGKRLAEHRCGKADRPRNDRYSGD